jgi:hypothetical protein
LKLPRCLLKSQLRVMYLCYVWIRARTLIPCRFELQCGNTRVAMSLIFGFAIAEAYADNVGQFPRPEKDLPLSV